MSSTRKERTKKKKMGKTLFFFCQWCLIEHENQHTHDEHLRQSEKKTSQPDTLVLTNTPSAYRSGEKNRIFFFFFFVVKKKKK